ncbi:LysR family transcriptional regulator [Ignatzschineria larvae DSM 13226]|uniref:LysR family transcriptional regulator n=1 Tax=Ignatzschineria larvae DSM 13226 TaxID=1111732 RepID=A0ABZ3BYX7_9GAMM|nr:LysR family transcriptional regulator [Ignatzschineria larvae]
MPAHTFKKIDLEDIQVFCLTAECQSFTEASILIGTTPSAISKAIARLEKKLSLKLFERSTRAMRLTEEGASYYAVCKEALADIQDIENQLAMDGKPRGTLRISAPDSYGMTVLIPQIAPFIEAHRQALKVEIALGNHFVNFTRESVDIAVRIGELEEARVVAKYLHTAQFKLVASPDYIAQFGTPQTIADLQQHQCIGIHFPDRGSVIPWEFGEKSERFPLQFAITHSHSMGALAHAVAGLGIVRLLDYSVQADIEKGNVIEILPGTAPPAMKVHLVYPSSRYIPAKTRLFIDYFMDSILPNVAKQNRDIDYFI